MAQAKPYTPPQAKRFTRDDAETAFILLEESRAGIDYALAGDSGTPRRSIMDAMDAAAALATCARAIKHIAENACNGYRRDEDEAADAKREAATLKRAAAILEPYGVKVRTGGDPRGACFYLMTPKTRAHNTWGGAESGWAVG